MRSVSFLAKMLLVGTFGVLSSSSFVLGQGAADQRGRVAGVEVLTDTQGVDFGPYLRQVLGEIRKNWIGLLPAEAQVPQSEASESVIRITIQPDGTLSAVHLDRSDRKVKFDRAAWGAITQVGILPPLPKAFTGAHLELRIDFAVNQKAAPTNSLDAR